MIELNLTQKELKLVLKGLAVMSSLKLQIINDNNHLFSNEAVEMFTKESKQYDDLYRKVKAKN